MSQKDPVIKRIGDYNFKMFMLPPLLSNRLLLEVTKMIGPSVGPVVDMIFNSAKSRNTNALDIELGSDFFSKAAQALFKDLEVATTERLIEAFSKVTAVDDQPLEGRVDYFFIGELDVMYQWLAWGLKVQWGKCLSSLVSAISAQQGATLAPAVLPSPMA
jgi:hypothetical protein